MTHGANTTSKPAPQRKQKVTLQISDGEVFHALPKMSEAEFDAFCMANPELRIEQDPHGNITIMSPSSYDSGNNEMEAGADLTIWNRRTKLGKVFSPSTLFKLPDGSKRMPDAAWISKVKHEQLSAKERKSFARIVPDFVIEVRSPSDQPSVLKDKMQRAWIKNGVQLAWLIDPEIQQAWIFRADGSETHIPDFQQVLSGESVLPGFELDLRVFIVE